jgi:prepilin-type processing-associated H-X9-DG protein
MGFWWFDSSQKVDHRYGDGLEVLMCPSKRQGDRMLEMNILAGNFGVNLSICKLSRYIKPYSGEFSGTPLSSANIAQPGETLLLVDSGYTLICWWQATRDPPVTLPPKPWLQNAGYVPGLASNRDRPLWPGQTEDALGGRHPQKTVNVGFVDGHVDRKKADDLAVEKTDDGQWNYSPLWQPTANPVTARSTSP